MFLEEHHLLECTVRFSEAFLGKKDTNLLAYAHEREPEPGEASHLPLRLF
jgi:hypothetical protein